MSYKPPFTITSKMLNLVGDIVEIIAEIKHLESNLNIPKLRKKNRIKSITGTLQIEGNSFSEEKVTNVINGKKVLGTMREIAEVKGAIKAYEYLDKYVFNKEADLLYAHKLMTEELLTNAGSYRHLNASVGSNNIVTHIAPSPFQVPELMGNLFEWLENTKEHPLIVSCVFHYEFEFIHPFSDGNGRIGRLWQSVILTHYKKLFGFIPIESVVRDNQEAYYKVLEDSGSAGESTPFIEFMLEVIFESLQKVGNKVGNKVGDYLSDNQKLIVQSMSENPKISAQKLSDIVGISVRKIEENISKLKEMKVIDRADGTRGYWEVLNGE